MDLNQFIKNFASQFDGMDASEFRPDKKFRELEGWSSLTALSIIAMVDDEYGVSIKGGDIRNASTINDLYDIVKSKL